MKQFLISLFIIIIFTTTTKAQGFAFGIKGGLTLGFQKWNNYERSALPRYNGSIYIESLPAEKRFSIFGELGYHVKGSRVRSFYRDIQTQQLIRHTNDTEFRNVSLILGGKSAYSITSGGLKAYYLFGVRGDYNINYNATQIFLPFNEEDVNKFTYGFSFGGGFEFPLSDLVGMTLEMQISPDARPQIFYPAGKYTYTDFSGNQVPAGETKVFNTVFEITVGFRFLRLVEYVEE